MRGKREKERVSDTTRAVMGEREIGRDTERAGRREREGERAICTMIASCTYGRDRERDSGVIGESR